MVDRPARRSESGAVVTSLHARDHARVYLKQMVDGTPEQRLSPEEERRSPSPSAARAPSPAPEAAPDTPGEAP